jgi:hypothetical protein
MIKPGDKVSLFNNIGKQGKVIGLIPIQVQTYFTGGSATNSWRIRIEWNDGTTTEENISDVMRLE